LVALPISDPFAGNPAIQPPECSSSDEHQRYAAAIIASLRAGCDIERKAHEYTRQQAGLRIIELEAQLARRDAELEACITNADNLLRHGLDQGRKSRCLDIGGPANIGPITNNYLSEEDAIQVINATSAKNKALELEVQALFNTVRRQFFSPCLAFSNSVPAGKCPTTEAPCST
jgi:hypothetical protein